MQPVISSNRLGMETQFQLSNDIPHEMRNDIRDVIGQTIPDYRFWIPSNQLASEQATSALVRPRDHSHTVHLTTANSVRRIDLLQMCLSLGFVLNRMYILELWISQDICISVACQTEPFNFHPRLLIDSNQIKGCLVTFTSSELLPNSSVEMMIISVICRTCGFARL